MTLIMVFKILFSLYLILSTIDFTHQSDKANTLLTSLKNLVIDNSRTTVMFNSTALRTLIALSHAGKSHGMWYKLLFPSPFSLYNFNIYFLKQYNIFSNFTLFLKFLNFIFLSAVAYTTLFQRSVNLFSINFS